VTDAGSSTDNETVTVYLYGDEREELQRQADAFKVRMEALPEVSDVKTDLERATSEIQIQIDEPLAQQYGITAQTIALTADAAMRGARLPYMKQGVREIPVWVQFREEDRKSRANLENVAVVGITGALVPLSRLVTFPKERTATSVHRYNGKNVIALTAHADIEDLGTVRNALAGAINAHRMPPGYHIDFGDTLQELGDNMTNFASTFIMAVILIYIVMAALFESVVLPLSVLSTVPLAMGGAVWMLYVTHSQFDSVTLIGCVLMAGVIVNNGIVIVDHINNLRAEEGDLASGIVNAGADRFRPVMMTALTTILGLVPMAAATSGSGATFAGLGRALIGGLTVGTVLTLVVVPVFYSLIDEFQQWCIGFLGCFKRGTAIVPMEDEG
jgi:HAE1 family hydrophobic/amphiphilic exporter-1